MLSAIATAGTITWLSISVKALVYMTTFMAMGSILAILTLRRLPLPEVQALRRLAIVCAIGAAVLSVARLPVRASFLMGGTWEGATHPMMLAMVSESPLGTCIALRLVGLVLICAILLPARYGRPLAVLGVVIVAASFAFRGHALEDPRFVLAPLITLHILGLAFWVGAFAPLYRLSTSGSGHVAGQVAHDFGRIAIWVVGGLTLAGGITLWLLTGNILTALTTPYGQFFALKLGAFLAIIGLAAWNKLRLTPAVMGQEKGATAHLRNSIRLEAAFVASILMTTAILTTVSAPEASDQTTAQTTAATAIGHKTEVNTGEYL